MARIWSFDALDRDEEESMLCTPFEVSDQSPDLFYPKLFPIDGTLDSLLLSTQVEFEQSLSTK